jgi:hypothetical protein
LDAGVLGEGREREEGDENGEEWAAHVGQGQYTTWARQPSAGGGQDGVVLHSHISAKLSDESRVGS